MAVLTLAGSALADIVGNPLTITATTATGLTATFDLPTSWGTWSNGGQDWTFTSPPTWSHEFWAGGEYLGRIGHMSVTIMGDPQVDVNFSTFGGATAATFTFSSGLLTFPAITGGTANASAGITLADVDGDGAFMTPTAPGLPMYEANFNGLVPAGTNYASFFNSPKTAFPGNSDSASMGPTIIPGTVTSMSAQFSFVLSANDLASGTSSFRIVPAPGAAAVIGLGLLSLARRRR